MAKLAIKKASTDVTVYLFIQASNVTTGAGLTGLTFETADLVASYVRPGAARAAITLATLAAADSAHSDGGFKEVDATNMPGIYRLDLPDAVCATGVNSVVVMLKGAANMAPVVLEVQLTNFDLNDASPEVTVADIANNAITAAAIAQDAIDADSIKADAITEIQSGLATPTNITAGTITTVTDVTNAVKISAGTGAGQLDFTSGVVKANLAQILGTALTETAGQIAAAFKKFFNVAAPTGTVNSLPDAVAGANGGLPTTNGTKVTQTVDLTAGQSIAANGGTVATATNLTNLPTIPNDWITAAGLKADAVGEIADAVWDEALAGHVVAGSAGDTLANIDVSGVADAVWDEALAGHVAAGSAGKTLLDIDPDTLADSIYDELSTIPAISLGVPANGEMDIYIADSLHVSISDLGSLADLDKLYVSFKERYEDTDAESILQLEESQGLLVVNGATATPTDGSITIDDAVAGDITLDVAASVMDDIAVKVCVYDVKVIRTAGVAVQTLHQGKAKFHRTVTRAVT